MCSFEGQMLAENENFKLIGMPLLDYKDSTGEVWFGALLKNYVNVANYVAGRL